MPRLPFCSNLFTVERVLEFNDHPALLPQGSRVLHVVAHQLSQCCELLTSVQIIVVTSILDLNVCYFREAPVCVCSGCVCVVCMCVCGVCVRVCSVRVCACVSVACV